jgi:long-chain acyl-CoA synthetase
MTPAQFVSNLAEFKTNKFFIQDAGASTYQELLEQTAYFQNYLTEKQVHAGDMVLVVGDFSTHSIALLLALFLKDCTVVPLTEASYSKMKPFMDVMKPDHLIHFDHALKTTTHTKIAATGSKSLVAKDAIPEPVAGLVVFTSGSTGTPKAIVHEVRPLLEKFQKRRAPHRAIPFLLFDHMGGINTVLSLASSGGSIVQVADRTMGALCSAIETHQVTLLPTTPTFLNLLLVSGERKEFDLSSLRLVTYGTEMMNETILKRLAEALPNCLFKQTYGMSEFGVIPSVSRDNHSTWLKLGGQGFETKIEDGILWVRAKSRMNGFFRFNATDTGSYAAVWNPAQDEWFCTGDRVDVDGEFVRFLGRDSDIINVSGLKVYPSEIEDCLLRSSLIKDVTVMGEPNLISGRMVTAHVVLADGIDPATARKELRAHCQANLEKFKIPAKFVFVEALSVSDRFKKARLNPNA